MSTEKIPWRKNLDPRYISGEDLIIERNGLKSGMVVTLASFKDVPTINQRTFSEEEKTGLWLKDLATSKILYKPMVLNNTNGKFLSKEIGGGSAYITDFNLTIPFVLWAEPHAVHGHVARFKKYYAPSTVSDVNALAKLNACEKTSEALNKVWAELSAPEKKLPTVLAAVEKLKGGLV